MEYYSGFKKKKPYYPWQCECTGKNMWFKCFKNSSITFQTNKQWISNKLKYQTNWNLNGNQNKFKRKDFFAQIIRNRTSFTYDYRGYFDITESFFFHLLFFVFCSSFLFFHHSIHPPFLFFYRIIWYWLPTYIINLSKYLLNIIKREQNKESNTLGILMGCENGMKKIKTGILPKELWGRIFLRMNKKT